jgi:2Fe-2S ferredoxin
MPKITYIEHDGTTHTVDAEVGATVMETALRNGITGIVAECGGSCTCATCHVYIDEAWVEKTGEPSPMEEDMLDFAFDARATSRLSCQIQITEELDGLVVRNAVVSGTLERDPGKACPGPDPEWNNNLKRDADPKKCHLVLEGLSPIVRRR